MANETRAYTTAQHPTSGETYAVLIEDGVIIEAAGPLGQDRPDNPDEDYIFDCLSNNSVTAADDGAWLEEALYESRGHNWSEEATRYQNA